MLRLHALPTFSCSARYVAAACAAAFKANSSESAQHASSSLSL
jgi:hypothetical protein